MDSPTPTSTRTAPPSGSRTGRAEDERHGWQEADRQTLAVRLMLAAGVVGPLLFIVTVLIEGATRPGYNAWHLPVSLLSLGPAGWTQVANFLISGSLIVFFAIGMRRVLRTGKGSIWGPIAVGGTGLALIGAGLFSIDPTLGYPPGAPTASTLHGALHLLVSNLMFITFTAACLVLARRFAADPAWHGWAFISIAAAALFIGLGVASTVVLSPDPQSPAGLLQRLSLLAECGWLSLFAWRLSRG